MSISSETALFFCVHFVNVSHQFVGLVLATISTMRFCTAFQFDCILIITFWPLCAHSALSDCNLAWLNAVMHGPCALQFWNFFVLLFGWPASHQQASAGFDRLSPGGWLDSVCPSTRCFFFFFQLSMCATGASDNFGSSLLLGLSVQALRRHLVARPNSS